MKFFSSAFRREQNIYHTCLPMVEFSTYGIPLINIDNSLAVLIKGGTKSVLKWLRLIPAVVPVPEGQCACNMADKLAKVDLTCVSKEKWHKW